MEEEDPITKLDEPPHERALGGKEGGGGGGNACFFFFFFVRAPVSCNRNSSEEAPAGMSHL